MYKAMLCAAMGMGLVFAACNDDGPLPVSAGSGGTPSGSGTGGNGSPDGTGGGTSPGTLDVQTGGYVVAPPWQGFGFTAASATGSTIEPPNYSDVSSANQLCATGSVAAVSDYSGTGMIGININQAQGTDPPIETWTPASIAAGGITVNVTNRGGSVIRVQLQAPGGANDGTKRWCAPVESFDKTVTIPWSNFNTTCWNGQGAAYAGEALESIILIVPGDDLDAVPFDFCLNGLSLASS